MHRKFHVQAMAAPRRAGVTVMELFLVVAGIIVIMSMILGLIGSKVNPKKDRDLRRMNDMQQMQKALSLYLDQVNRYPVYEGCLSGTDAVNQGLRDHKVIEGSISDPTWKTEKPAGTAPEKMIGCYWYSGNGANYSVKFFLETPEYTSRTGLNVVQQ